MLISKLTLSELIKKVAAGKSYLRANIANKDMESYQRNAKGLAELVKELKKYNIPDEPSEYAPLIYQKRPLYSLNMPEFGLPMAPANRKETFLKLLVRT